MACNLLWPCSLIETLDRFSGIHRSQKVYLAEQQGVRKSDFYSESLSVECLCCYICNAAGRGFQTKSLLSLDTLTSLHSLNSTHTSQSDNAI